MTWYTNEKLTNRIILVLSVVIPAVVVALRYIPQPDLSESTKESLYTLPMLNAAFNGSAFVMLIAALIAIKAKRIAWHRAFTTTAMILSVLFLVSYVAFHYTSPETPFGGSGTIKGIYYFILITHILLSAVIVPMALLAYTHGLAGRYVKHKRIVKIAYPMWLYVTLTGVIVYLMISPYYPY
jgi:putative membrane protein